MLLLIIWIKSDIFTNLHCNNVRSMFYTNISMYLIAEKVKRSEHSILISKTYFQIKEKKVS
jgi:hypothetical protein